MASTVANSLNIKGSVAWSQEQVNEGGSFRKSGQGPDSLVFNLSPSATTFTEVLIDKFTLAAAGSQTVNFRSFTNLLGTAVTNTKLKGLLIKATATVTGGQLKIIPGASNDLQWPFGAAADFVTLDVGTDGCLLVICNGTTVTVGATDATWDLSNPGSQSIVVYIVALVGA